MDYLGARQATLAQNVANVDTPGYRSRDLETPNFSKMVSSSAPSKVQMWKTNPLHQSGLKASSGQKDYKLRETYETNFNKNTVSIEEEMKKVSDTQMEYQTVTNLYRKTVEMFKTASGRAAG
jgi:flagellar basal-body rod protein FlgB